MRMNLKNIGGLILLIGFFWGFIALISGSAKRGLENTKTTIETQAAAGAVNIGPVQVHYQACHYLFPVGSLDRFMGFVTCPSCGDVADGIRKRFIVTLVEPQCARRGYNSMFFTPLNSPNP